MSQSTFPRLLELINSLTVVARSGRNNELRANINLVTGYLTELIDVLGAKDLPLRSFLESAFSVSSVRKSLAGKLQNTVCDAIGKMLT